MYVLQDVPDKFAVVSGNIRTPVATLKDEYGGVSQIIVDDGCYVLANGDSKDGFVTVEHWYKEAYEAMKTLPSPRESERKILKENIPIDKISNTIELLEELIDKGEASESDENGDDSEESARTGELAKVLFAKIGKKVEKEANEKTEMDLIKTKKELLEEKIKLQESERAAGILRLEVFRLRKEAGILEPDEKKRLEKIEKARMEELSSDIEFGKR